MVAEHGVVLAQEDKSFSGGKAVYTPTNGWLELTGNPAWRAGSREGKGNRLLVNLTNSELIVRGNASMRVPAGEIAATHTAPGAAKPSGGKGGTNQFADIFAEEYNLRRDHDRLVSHFSGGVYISHTNMNLVCASMTVRAPLEGSPGEVTLTAEQDVEFDLLDEKNQMHHGTGDKLVCTRSSSPGATNDILVLTGRPAVLQTTNGPTARNTAFTLDRARGTISGSGPYVFTGYGPALDTNKIRFPKK
jgi:lipopolysaccharide export system protein LptA